MDTQINIDFSSVIGKGNYLYFKDTGIYLIDEYSNNEILENKSSGLQRVAIIICLLNLFKVSNKLNSYILMIDEPENNLHAHAQKKILHLLREFSKKHQVIVSTHSTVFLENIRDNELNYIDRNTNQGSFVDNKNIGTNNFLRLRNSLGIEVTDTLFIGNKVILVEGESDVILHIYIYNRLYPTKPKVTFFTMEGAANAPQNVIAFTQIIGKPLTIILDNDIAGRSISEKLENNNFTRKTNILFQPICIEEEQNKELEDLFPKDFITKTIKDYINLPDPQKTLKETLGDNFENIITEYIKSLSFFENYKDIEEIGTEEKFNLSTQAFARRIKSELNLLDNQGFSEVTKNFNYIYNFL